MDRSRGEVGFCRATDQARVYRHRIEYSEELELVPSHLFYLSGCNLRCAFCVAGIDAFDPTRGEPLTSDFFSEALAWGFEQGVHNLQWVGGEPTIHLPAVLAAMSGVPSLPPIAWKSAFHCTPEALDLLDGIVDVYVADFKFGNNACAERIAGVKGYLEILARNLEVLAHRADLIVRHLLLPGHFDCCYRPIVDWMARFLPDVKFSLRDGYLPSWRAHQHDELARVLPAETIHRARDLAVEKRLNLIQ